jgi:tetratricopeptide (TPR) repeat protein
VASLLNAFKWAFVRAPRTLESWSLDRNWNRVEAHRHLKAGNYAEAEEHLLMAVRESDQQKYSATKRVRLRLELADVQRKLAWMGMEASREANMDTDKLVEAEQTIRGAVLIAARAASGDAYTQCLDALTEVFGDQRNYPSMEKAAEEAIRLGASLAHPDQLRMARRVHWLGVARFHNGRLAEAIPPLEKSLALHEANYGADHLITAGRLSEIGRIYRARGDHGKAQDCLRRALRIHAAEYGPDSPQALSDLAALAGSFEDSGNLEAAAAEYERALMLKQRKLGVGNLDEVAEMQFSLASLHLAWNNVSRARELLAECIGTFRRTGGPRLAVALETQAQVEERSGRFFDAVRELEFAATAWRKCERFAELIHNMEYRADLLAQLRKGREATWLREQAAQLAEETGVTAHAAGLTQTPQPTPTG